MVVQETKAAGRRPEEQSKDGHAHVEADCVEGASSLDTDKSVDDVQGDGGQQGSQIRPNGYDGVLQYVPRPTSLWIQSHRDYGSSC